MGCSPYFAATGTHPILPFDIAEANYLLLPPDSVLSSRDLIAQHAITLQKHCQHLLDLRNKVYKARVQAVIRFKKEHANTIQNCSLSPGDLVLICKTAIEKSLNHKMRAWYLGPQICISPNKCGVYILIELD